MLEEWAPDGVWLLGSVHPSSYGDGFRHEHAILVGPRILVASQDFSAGSGWEDCLWPLGPQG